jgi:hypothetical protein
LGSEKVPLNIARTREFGSSTFVPRQRKVEMSYSLQSKNVRFWLRLEKVGVSLAVPVKRRRAMLASNPIEE